MAYKMRAIERRSFREIGATLGISYVEVVRDVLGTIDNIDEEQVAKMRLCAREKTSS